MISVLLFPTISRDEKIVLLQEQIPVQVMNNLLLLQTIIKSAADFHIGVKRDATFCLEAS
jgi:hypothetical protein